MGGWGCLGVALSDPQRVAALAVVTAVLSLTTATARADENVPVHDPRPGFKVYVTYEPGTLPHHEPGAPLPLPRQPRPSEFHRCRGCLPEQPPGGLGWHR